MHRTSIRTSGFAALACCTALAVLASPAPAAGENGGASAEPTEPKRSAAAPSAAGQPAPAAPAGPAGPLPEAVTLGAPTCRTHCSALDAARPGSVVRVGGEGLQSVTELVFLGGAGREDDVRAPAEATPGTAEAEVPPTAATGPVAVVTADGSVSAPTTRALRIGVPGAPAVQAAVAAQKVFFGGRRAATLDVFVPAGAPREVAVDVVRVADGAPIARLDAGSVAPESVASVEWRGVAGGRVQKDGRYAFRLASPAPAADAPFTFLRNQFPIRGKHRYGEGAAHFGAGRGGGSHEGEDVFAACGTPLVAARGGKVKKAGFQARAGNYLVIDGDGTGSDHAYMHLRDPVAFEAGDVVATGQPIGVVGDTGSANGCHLHFEVWTAPGWYTGGRPVDPLAELQEWDTQSGVQTPAVAKRAVAARARAATR
jgi:murein DD-endopeptidase MepM/ murein hydrolase activator NlpD